MELKIKTAKNTRKVITARKENYRRENLDWGVDSRVEVIWCTKSKVSLLARHKDSSEWLGGHIWIQTSG